MLRAMIERRALLTALRQELDICARDAESCLDEADSFLTSAKRKALEQLAHFEEQAPPPTVQHGTSPGRLIARLTTGKPTDRAHECLVAIRDSQLFFDGWYLKQNPHIAESRTSPLVHYLVKGAYEGRNPNPLFDVTWYLKTYSDVADTGLNPLLHYVKIGERQGRRPHPGFDPSAYLDANPDVASDGMSPLRHYLFFGQREGRAIERRQAKNRPLAPSLDAFTPLARGMPRDQRSAIPAVSIIVPVYRGYDDTLACLYSVLSSSCKTPFDVTVVNDQSPDLELSAALRKLDELQLISLLENEKNLGFVRSVNRGIQLNRSRDVLLLNSDTVVYNDWLDRMIAHLKKRNVATVTPFSNNATICSYPRFGTDNSELLEIDYGELDEIVATQHVGDSVDVPTGVGFCMLICGNALDEVGLFDEVAFGKGYGEENDFCMRAAQRGWRNIHALDVFVRHTGQTSFGTDASIHQKRGMRALRKLHPSYNDQVQEYVRSDPAKSARRSTDLERLRRHLDASETKLCLTHNWGGGIERYLRDQDQLLKKHGTRILVLRPRTSDFRDIGSIVLNTADAMDLPNLEFNLPDAFEEGVLVDALRSLNVQSIEVSSLVGWPDSALQEIPGLARSLSLPYEVMLHDYAPVCPRINLVDQSGVYCGELGESFCRSCLARRPNHWRRLHGPRPFLGKPKSLLRPMAIDIALWRKAYEGLLQQAKRSLAPSWDTAIRYRKYFPDVRIDVVPHREFLPAFEHSLARPYTGGEIRIAVIGSVGLHKGSRVVETLARNAIKRRLPLRFIVIGSTNIDSELSRLSNVEITGRYDDEDIYSIIESHDIHLAFLPSVCPETFSYTFSITQAALLPTIVFDIGAQAERVVSHPYAKTVPLALAKQQSRLNDLLIQTVTGKPEQTGMSGSTREQPRAAGCNPLRP